MYRMWLRLALGAIALHSALSAVVCPARMATGETHYCFSSSQATLQLLSASGPVSTATAVPGNQHLYEFLVPQSLAAGNYSVQEVGSTAVASVELTGPGAMLLLEADRAFYKPGQIVRFRSLALSPLLRPLRRNVSLEVMSQEGFKLLRSSKESDDFGIAEFSFPISKEPLLGKYSAHVSVDEGGAGAMAEASFTVEEYVLPRFEVGVTLDQLYLTAGTGALQSISGKVKANFTFGEAVTGPLSLTIWSSLRGAGEHRVHASLTGLQLDKDGGASFRTEISANPGSVVVEATVLYPPTGEQQSGTAQLPVLYQGANLQAELKLSDGLQVFRPGLPTRLRLRLSKPDGATPSEEELASGEMVLVVQKNTVSWNQRPKDLRILLSPAAMQVVQIPVTMENASCCNPSASRRTWQEHEEACGCCVTHMNFYVEHKMPGDSYFQRIWDSPDSDGATACAGRAYSPSGHYLAVDAPQETEGRWSALLRTTRQPNEQELVEYVLTQSGALKAAGESSVSFAANGGTWEATLPLDLPSNMSGELQLLVMHPKEVTLTASAHFDRPLQPVNLSCNFSTREAKPGENLTVSVESQAPGRTYLAALDRSAELLGARSAISESAILSALLRTARGKETKVAGKAWRHCTYGVDFMIAAELQDFKVVDRGTTGSDDAVYGEPLGANCPRPLYDGTVCSSGGHGGLVAVEVMAMDGAVPEVAGRAEEDDSEAQAASGSTGSTVRTFFPETWIWEHVDMEPSGGVSIGSLAVKAPDTITSWSLDAFSITADGIATTKAEPLRVFKPFFVEMRFPYAAVRGEDLELIIAVFNYAGRDLSAQVEVTLPPQLELLEGNATALAVVPENQATRIFLRVRPKELGAWDVLCSATAETLRDAMRKPLLVKPEGIPVSTTETIVVDLTGAESFSESKRLYLPENAVDGSARLKVTAVGDLLGPSISGLERLLQIPTGCGEQNMITLAPNVYVAKYLLATKKMTPDLRERIANNMVVGYGRQLTYRHSDGSFSAFGSSDPSGSTWLTAFVLRTFLEVQETGLVAVDQGVLNAAAEFLRGAQQADGSFQSLGQVIHKEMLGGSGTALSAYVASALAKVDSLSAVSKSFLEAESSSTYTALLRAHALLLSGHWSQDDTALKVLELSESSGSRRWWSGSAGHRSLEIEMTGYGILALTSVGRLGEAFQAVQWLLERRTALGGFSSTQDTVVALNALASYAAAAGQSADMAIEVVLGDFRESLRINAANMDVLQSLSPTASSGSMPVTVTGSGNGMALVIANLQYNVPDAVTPCYTVEVELFSSGSDVQALRACGAPLPSCGTPVMAIMSVGLFTGYSASLGSLQALKDAKVVKRFEQNDGRVDLYLEELREKTCVQFNVTKEFQVWNVQPAASMIYEYYEPQSRGETLTALSTQDFTHEVSQLPGISRVWEQTSANAAARSWASLLVIGYALSA